ncbi:WD repeat-containing and planar cell polarity effector protein fritz homolog [Salmo trutta]|nr:WD repeat-containing and planar cell polarity effector protein fritz homolog [Salmo trutta]
MLAFHGGPLAALRFRLGALSGGQLGPGELLQQRLRCGQVDQALGILGAMEWSTMRTECYRSLTSVTDYLLRLELDQTREAQLEAALGVFYAPPRPLSDSVVLEYRGPISKYARRFFHHLLRHQRFEKAFLLAVDIGARDLFMQWFQFTRH